MIITATGYTTIVLENVIFLRYIYCRSHFGGSFFSHLQVIGFHYADRFLLRLQIVIGIPRFLRDDRLVDCNLNSLF